MRNTTHLLWKIIIVLVVWTTQGAAASRLVPVSTPNELRFALAGVQDGDVIELASGVYLMSDLSGSDEYFFISNPTENFTVRAAAPGMAFIDGEGTSRLLRLDGDPPSAAGWVTFEGLVFQNGNTTELDAGGLKIKGGRATFIDCVFQNNTATPNLSSGAAAGAQLITNEAVVQFVRCQWIANSSDNHGGAMLIGQGSRVMVHDSQFLENRNNLPGHRPNGLGGAIHAYNSLEGTTTVLQVANTRFSDNQAAFVGGAIVAKGNFVSQSQDIASPTSVIVTNCSFSNNIAMNDQSVSPNSPTEGGAIMAENNVMLEVYNSRFFGNSAGFGGAVSSFRSAVTVESSIFRNNTAFGRPETESTGRGGAIKIHASDNCSDPTNYPTGKLVISDSFFEENTSQAGGCIFAAGDTNRRYSTVPGCQMGALEENRLPVVLDRVTMTGCSVDDIIGNNAVGGGFYGLLVDLICMDSLVVDSSASGTDPSNPSSSSQGHGGAASIRQESLVVVTDSTFAGNSADHEGGALQVLGSDIAEFSDNIFYANVVSPGANRPVNESKGAALYLGPLTSKSLDVTGAVNNSIFTGNMGLPIFESDATLSNPCDCGNYVTYDGNSFYNTTYEDDVFRNTLVSGAHTAPELNALIIDRGDGDTTKKSPLETNFEETEPITTATLLSAPQTILSNTAPGDEPPATESFLSWVWSGGCAELDGTMFDPTFDNSIGFTSAAVGDHSVVVWSGGECTGLPDLEISESVFAGPDPEVNLVANPDIISGGDSTTLSWHLVAGELLDGLISHGVINSLSEAAGSVDVTPPNTVDYQMTVVTKQGGAYQSERVWVDEEPPHLFVDDFETGDLSRWSSSAQ